MFQRVRVSNQRKRLRKGFTLIELVMVILLLAILAAIAIPNFIDFRIDAKNASAHGALGAFRAAIAIATAAVALKEDPTVPSPRYPTVLEMQGNQFNASHPILSAAFTKIMDPAEGIPANPWTVSTAALATFNSIYDCTGLTKGFVSSVVGNTDQGWCYDQTLGTIWANSRLNGGGIGKTENTF